MTINVASCKLKMVVVIATALALGVGAVAACVVPWLYCKPTDGSDDDRETTAIREDIASQSRSNKELNNTTSIAGVRVIGINFFKVENARQSTGNQDSAQSTSRQSETANSTELNANVPQNPTNDEARFSIQADQIRPRCSGDIDPRISRVSNFASIAMRTNNSENASEDTEESSDVQSLEVAITKVQIFESRVANWGATQPSLMVKIEEDPSNAVKTIESSNPTDESSNQTTVRTSSGTSGLNNSESTIPTDEQSAEKTTSSKNAESVKSRSEDAEKSKMNSIKFKSPDPGLTNPESLEPGSLNQIKEDTSSNQQRSGSSNPTEDSSTETTEGTSTSQESKNSPGTSKIVVVAVIESSKNSEVLETIPEVSSCSTSLQEASPSAVSSEDVLPKPSKISNLILDQEVSLISISSPNSTHSISYNDQNSDTKKIPRRSRYASGFITRVNRILHGMKLDRTPRILRKEVRQEFHTESLQSLSTGTKVPAGHSTLKSVEQHSLETVRIRRSMASVNYLSKQFEDPRIVINAHLNEAESGLKNDEEPLDLSIRASLVCNENMENLSPSEKKGYSCTSGFSREVFREVKEYLRVRRSSRTSEEGTSRSDSLKFYGDSSKSVVRDENQNFTSDSSIAVDDEKFDDTRECTSDPEGNVRCQERTKGKRKPRRFKNIFDFGNKYQSKESDKVSSSSRKKKDSDNVPVEFQRNFMGMSSKPNKQPDAKIESTSESPADSYSYLELDFAILDEERNLREPCTEL